VQEAQVDHVVLATGYKYRFEFLRGSGLLHETNERSVRKRVYCAVSILKHRSFAKTGSGKRRKIWKSDVLLQVRPLYRHVFHVEQPSLAFIGLPFKVYYLSQSSRNYPDAFDC
jgi:hypothetical protein